MKVPVRMILMNSDGWLVQQSDKTMNLESLGEYLPAAVEDLLEYTIKDWDGYVEPAILNIYEALSKGDYINFYDLYSDISSDAEDCYFSARITTKGLYNDKENDHDPKITIRIRSSDILQSIQENISYDLLAQRALASKKKYR